MDEILQRFGLKYDDLNVAEKETLNTMLSSLQQKQLTVERVKEYIHSMRDAVEDELENEPEFTYIFIFRVPNRKEILLKARLRNYRLLEAFLYSPDKAKKAIESAVAGIPPKRK